MALLDILIGIVIGFVGGVVVPAAVMYRYRHRIGQWFIERQASRAVEEGFGLDEAAGDAGLGMGGLDAPGTNEMSMDEADFDVPTTGGAGFDESDTVRNAPDGTGTAEHASTPGATTAESGGETRRCDCGELVSPKLDDACPNCGAPVGME